MKIIGVVGRNGSGKDALLNYVEQRCGVPIVSAGDVARSLAEKEGVEQTRQNLHQISEKYKSRYGEDYFMRRLNEKIEGSHWQVAGITGIRAPEDVRALRSKWGEDFLLVHVEVTDPMIRFRRMQQRGKPRDPDTKEEFFQMEEEEEQMFHISRTVDMADITINNDGTLEEFHQNVQEKIIEPILEPEGLCKD